MEKKEELELEHERSGNKEKRWDEIEGSFLFLHREYVRLYAKS